MAKHPRIESEYAKEFFFEGDRIGVLLVHGFTGSPSHMRPLGESIYDKLGHTVLGILLPGHGSTIQEMEQTGWADWLESTRLAFNRLAQSCDEVYVCGLSMGGVLTLMMAEEMLLAGAISISTPMRLRDRTAGLAKIIWPLLRYRGWRNPPNKDASKYDIGYADTPVRKVPDLLYLMKQARTNLHKITCPLLIIQPKLDETVRPISAHLIYDGAINAMKKKIIWLEQSKHVCTIQPEFDKLLSSIEKFIEEA